MPSTMPVKSPGRLPGDIEFHAYLLTPVLTNARSRLSALSNAAWHGTSSSSFSLNPATPTRLNTPARWLHSEPLMTLPA
jgi:hypothetical protein